MSGQFITKQKGVRIEDGQNDLKRLIAFTTSYYKHWFMVSLNVVVSRA